MKKQKKKSLQIVKRIVTLFLILAITSTQIEPSVFAASSDGQWASESLKEDAVTENESADATADSTGTTNTDESHTDESETAKKPETTDGTAQDPGNTDNTDGTAQNPDNTDNTDKTEQDSGNTDNTDKTAQDPDNTDTTDKTAQDQETTVTEEQPTEEPDENLSAADAVLPVEISYYLPKFQELKIEAPEEYTDTEQQEEARAAVTDQAMADETTQKLLEQAEKDAESADADESALDTQALTESAVSEEEYVSYTQMAVTGDTLAAPAVSLPDDVQLDPEADPEDTDPLIGWQVAKLAGIVLYYADGTKINEGDVIPADQINEVSAAAADDGIALMSIDESALAQLIALTQDMTVVQRVGAAGANGKWSILVQGGTNQTETQGTVRHAYGTLADALDAIKADTSSTSFKITFLDDYTATKSDWSKLKSTAISKPTIIFTGAVNYKESTSYESWTTFSIPSSVATDNRLYFDGFNAYFTHIKVNWNNLSVYFNRNNTTFSDMEFVSPVTAIYGGSYSPATTVVDYKLVFDNVEMRKDAPVKQIFGGGQDASKGTIQLNISNCVIYGNVYATGGPYNNTSLYQHTGSVNVNMSEVSIHPFNTANGTSDMLNPSKIHEVGGSFWGTYAKNVTGGINVSVTGKYEADYGTWFSAGANCKTSSVNFDFRDITNTLKMVGTYQYPGTDGTSTTRNTITVANSSVTNIFGYSALNLTNCDVSYSEFGHIQYDSSFYHYWLNLPASRANPKTYTPDQRSENGYTTIKNSIIGSAGTIYEGTWNRQRYGTIVLDDSNSKFIIYSGGKTNGSNVVQMKNLTATNNSYKTDIYLTIAAPTTQENAAAMLSITDKNALQSSFSCLRNAKTSAGVGCYARQDTANNLIKMYTPAKSQYSMFLYKGNSDTGTPLASKNSFADILEALRTQTAGTYTIKTIGGFTLSSKDQTAFNKANGFANKDVIIKTSGAVCGAATNDNPSDDKTRWSRMYPHFNSLTWEGAEFRADFPEYSGQATTEVKFYANGHSLKFKDCVFVCPNDIIAGTYNTETTNQSVKLEFVNCKGIRNVYSNYWNQQALNDVEILITSSSGFTYAVDGARDPINIDPAKFGAVDNLTINIEDCEANINPSYPTLQMVNKAFALNMNGDVKTYFSVPKNATGYSSTVNLNGNVALTKDCQSYTGNSTVVNVKGNVKTQAGTNVYLNDISTINVDGGILQLGDSSTKAEGGISGNSTTTVSLKNKGKLNFAYAPQTESKRTIYKLTTDTTDTELSIMYDYNGTSTAPAGRPLIVQNTMSLASSSKKLRVSTSLMPKHTGTTEYPLIQFSLSSNAKLDQYTWIADQRYYLAKGSNASQIVLRADTYAPMSYQLSAPDVTLNSDNSETRSISLYIQDYVRNAIDKTGASIRDASNNAYPSGVQVYLSTQDVQLKDGIYGYVYDSKGDIQLDGSTNSAYATTNWYTSGTYTNINGASITASTTSPVLRVSIKSRTYKAYTNYFIYVRDVAGNWSKFLLDTQGPSMSSYGNVTSTRNSDGTFNYTFSNLKFNDVIQSTSDGTSDISDLSYVSNASKFINTSRSISEVKYNTTGLDPWKNSGTNVSFNSSTGVCTLTNVKLTTDKLYIFAKDGYGNKSKYEFVPVTFDAQCGGEVPDGKLSNGARYFSTLRPIQGYLGSQMPNDPTLKNLSFKYWYKSTDSTKSNAYLTTMKVTEAATYYPLWNYPTLTISNTVTGSAGDKTKPFTYTVQVKSKSGSIYRGTEFSYTGSSISGVTAPSEGTFTSNPTAGDLTFGLKHGQSITITLKDYYDSVYVVQTKESEYWTSYTTEGNVKYNSTVTEQVAVDAVNRIFAFTNSNDKSQPVVYQSKIKEGTWSESEGNSYKRGINLYIRDLYGSGVDMTGESFTTEEKGIYPSNVGSIGHIYLSPQDAKLVNGKYDYVYNKNTDYLLNDVGSGIWEASTQTDINGNTIPVKAGYPILRYYFNSEKNIAFDQDTNYFIYVRDKTGTWTKFLLDTKGPVVKEQGTVTVTKQGSNYVYSIKNLKFEDEQIIPANGTSALSNAADEKFSYDANATTYNTAINSEVRYNTTGHDPFVSTASASQYKTATNNGDGTYTISNVSLTAGQKLYVFSQDAYGNVSAVQYVPVTFDATEGGAHKKTAFDDNKTIKSMLVRKGEKLIADQIPKDPRFTVATTQKFLNWYVSTDTTNKAKVDLANYVVNAGVTFYANYEMPGITITQSVAGDASNKNQEFEYLVKLSDADGNKLVDGTKIPYVAYVVAGSGAETPNIGELTVTGTYGEISFSLKHGQAVKLLPGALKYKVDYIHQKDSGYTCTYEVDGQEAVENTWAYDISIDEIEGQINFINTKDIVVTGISDGLNSKTLPIVGLAAAVVMLGASALMLKRRRRS